MCVIIVKKKGVNVPSKELLMKAAAANSDGCGFATSSGKYFRSTDFDEFWHEFRKYVRKSDDVVIHFRWATHGSVKAENCHPFKGEVNGEEIFFAHNGVLPVESVNDMTDSEICFREQILPMLNATEGFTRKTSAVIRSIADGSRFAFVDANGLHLYGQYEKYQGLLLSNTRFLWYRPIISTRGITDRYWGVGI